MKPREPLGQGRQGLVGGAGVALWQAGPPSAGQGPLEVEDGAGHPSDVVGQRGRTGSLARLPGQRLAWGGQRSLALLARARRVGEEARQSSGRVGREAVLADALTESRLPLPRGLRQLQREGRRHLAALHLALERLLQPLEEAQPPAHPLARAAHRPLDLGRAVAFVEEVTDRSRLLQGADPSPHGVEQQPSPARSEGVVVMDPDRDARPAQLPHGPVAEGPVHQLVGAVLAASHVEGVL